MLNHPDVKLDIPDQYDDTAFTSACRAKNVEIVKMLLEKGVNT